MTRPEDVSCRYLYGVLADGSRQFRYRNRVRSLLGLPASEGVKVSFGSMFSNMMNFSYKHLPFEREFYLAEEVSDIPARRITNTEGEFISLPLTHADSELQRNTSAEDLVNWKHHFSDISANQALHKTESPQANPLNLPNIVAQKAIADRRNLEEHNIIQIPGSSKNETAQAAETQLPSNLGNEHTVYAQVASSSSLRQDEFRNVVEVQGQSRRAIPTMQPAQSSSVPAQTSSSSPPNQAPLAYLRPQTMRIQNQALTEENLEEQGQNLDLPQLTSMKATKDRTASFKPPLSSTESESKLSAPRASGQKDIPPPNQPVTVLWGGIEPKPKNHAFWERRHLSHFRLRLLR